MEEPINPLTVLTDTPSSFGLSPTPDRLWVHTDSEAEDQPSPIANDGSDDDYSEFPLGMPAAVSVLRRSAFITQSPFIGLDSALDNAQEAPLDDSHETPNLDQPLAPWSEVSPSQAMPDPPSPNPPEFEREPPPLSPIGIQPNLAQSHNSPNDAHPRATGTFLSVANSHLAQLAEKQEPGSTVQPRVKPRTFWSTLLQRSSRNSPRIPSGLYASGVENNISNQSFGTGQARGTDTHTFGGRRTPQSTTNSPGIRSTSSPVMCASSEMPNRPVTVISGPRTAPPPAPSPPTLKSIGLTLGPMTPALSVSKNHYPLCGALLDGKYILIGTTQGLDFLPIPAAGSVLQSLSSKSRKELRKPIPLIKRTRFKELAILNERSHILLAIAGRNDHIRVYALDGIRSMIEKKMHEVRSRDGYRIIEYPLHNLPSPVHQLKGKGKPPPLQPQSLWTPLPNSDMAAEPSSPPPDYSSLQGPQSTSMVRGGSSRHHSPRTPGAVVRSVPTITPRQSVSSSLASPRTLRAERSREFIASRRGSTATIPRRRSRVELVGSSVASRRSSLSSIERPALDYVEEADSPAPSPNPIRDESAEDEEWDAPQTYSPSPRRVSMSSTIDSGWVTDSPLATVPVMGGKSQSRLLPRPNAVNTREASQDLVDFFQSCPAQRSGQTSTLIARSATAESSRNLDRDLMMFFQESPLPTNTIATTSRAPVRKSLSPSIRSSDSSSAALNKTVLGSTSRRSENSRPATPLLDMSIVGQSLPSTDVHSPEVTSATSFVTANENTLPVPEQSPTLSASPTGVTSRQQKRWTIGNMSSRIQRSFTDISSTSPNPNRRASIDGCTNLSQPSSPALEPSHNIAPSLAPTSSQHPPSPATPAIEPSRRMSGLLSGPSTMAGLAIPESSLSGPERPPPDFKHTPPAPIEPTPSSQPQPEVHPANSSSPLEYVKLARTKGARLLRAVETKKRTYLAVLCGEEGERIELFTGSRSISLSLNRTFVLPEKPRTIEFQLQGDDLIDIYLVYPESIFALEPATVRVREVGVGRGERRARRERERERRMRESNANNSENTDRPPSPVTESVTEPEVATINETEEASSRSGTPIPEISNSVQDSGLTPISTPFADSQTNPTTPAQPTLIPPGTPSPRGTTSTEGTKTKIPYTTFQQLPFVPPVPSSVLASAWIIPPLYTDVVAEGASPSLAGSQEPPLLSPISLLNGTSQRANGPPGLFFVSKGKNLSGIVTGDGRSVIKKPLIWTSEKVDYVEDYAQRRIEMLVTKASQTVVVAVSSSEVKAIAVGGELDQTLFGTALTVAPTPTKSNHDSRDMTFIGTHADTNQLFFTERIHNSWRMWCIGTNPKDE